MLAVELPLPCAEQMQLPLPAALLRQLVEEWERVTKQGLLPALPRRPCVNELLDKFKASGFASI